MLKKILNYCIMDKVIYMKKITILALHLGYGGIEKCISSISNELCNKYDIEIIVVHKMYEKTPFDMNKRIKIKYLLDDTMASKTLKYKVYLKNFQILLLIKNLFNDYFKLLRIGELFKDIKNSYITVKKSKSLLIKEIKNCDSDVIISTRDKHNYLLGKFAKEGIIKIGWEHNYHNNDRKYIKNLVKSVEKLDYLVLVSEELQEFYSKIVKPKCIHIPNSLDEYPKEMSSLEENNIISVGRLSKEKGFLDLIDVYALLNEVYPNWKLNIIGDGTERTKIEEKITKLNLKDKVILHGYQDKKYINEILSHSSIYVMPSYTESFGIVLLEAFSYGIPCISFENSGSKEIISNNWDGYLIKERNKEQMAKKICELIKDKNRRIIMGDNGYKKSLKYDIKEIIKKWIDLIER